MKKLSTVIALLLAGCTATAPVQPYTPPDAADPLMLSGRWNGMSKIVLTVNGEAIATGDFGVFGTNTDLQGQYDGRNVAANCTYSMGFWSEKVNCITFVDGRRGPTLTFVQ